MLRKGLLLTGLLVVVSLVLGGCGQQLTATEIVDRVRQTAESTKDAHAVITVAANVQGMELSATAEVWEKSPNKVRAEVIESSQPELKGTVLVSDGEQAWLYDPAENMVMTGKAGELDLPLPEQMLANMQEMVQQVLDVSNVQLDGEETIAGHATYKLILTPKEGQESMMPGNGTATLWVDQERWIVLKATYEASSLGEGTLEVQSYELNSGVDDDRFQFQVPEGAKVVNAEVEKPVSLTLDEARAQAGFPLLVPEYVPEGVTLIEVFRQGGAIILRYNHSPQTSFTILEGKDLPERDAMGESSSVTINGVNATAVLDKAGGNTLLFWTQDGISIAVAGHISLDEAVKVGESLK